MVRSRDALTFRDEMAETPQLNEGQDELDQLVFRRSKRPNLAQREDYLGMLLEGVPHVTAAHRVGSTGTAFKSARKNDGKFARLCEQAERRAPSAREDQVRASLWEILYEPNHPKHWEAVRFAAEIYLEETEFKRIRQVHKRIDMEAALAATLQISIDALRQMPDEKLDSLIGTMEELEATPRLAIVE
jgi:hypothetical protein